jgi:hypothetical protein
MAFRRTLPAMPNGKKLTGHVRPVAGKATTSKKQQQPSLGKKLAKKYYPIYEKAVAQHEKDHPHWRIEVLVSLIKWSLKSLKHYIEDVRDSQITWECPLVELHYPIEWNWKEKGGNDMPPGGHVFGKLTRENTATKELAVKTLSQMLACRFNAIALAGATNWAWFVKQNNYYTPVFTVQLTEALNAIESKRERRESFEELVRPFSIGAARIDLSGMKMKSGTRVSKRVIRQLAESHQRMDIQGIRFTGDVNGREFDMGLIFEIHPLIADYDQKKAYHPVVVGLAVLNGNARLVGGEVVQDTPAKWSKSDRAEFWEGLLRKLEELTGLLIPKTESQESVILSVNSTLKIPVEHWRPENRSTEIKKVADALAQVGEVDGLEVKSTRSIGNACPICGSVHDAGFTQIKPTQGEVIALGGILPDIVAVVHRAHEKGLTGLSSKNEELLKICAGYKHPCKAFDDLKCRDGYKKLFDTRKRGFISLHGAIGTNRNNSEASPE